MRIDFLLLSSNRIVQIISIFQLVVFVSMILQLTKFLNGIDLESFPLLKNDSISKIFIISLSIIPIYLLVGAFFQLVISALGI